MLIASIKSFSKENSILESHKPGIEIRKNLYSTLLECLPLLLCRRPGLKKNYKIQNNVNNFDPNLLTFCH